VELETFPTALISAVVISLLSTLPAQLLRLALSPAWFLTSVGGLLKPVSFLFDWLIMALLFGLAAWLVPGFRLRNGLMSAILGALVYSVVSSIVLHLLGV
jgi:putative membrane protein